MPSIPDQNFIEVLHLMIIPSVLDLPILHHCPLLPLSILVFFRIFPIHALEKVQGQRVRYDDVELSVVDEHSVVVHDDCDFRLRRLHDVQQQRLLGLFAALERQVADVQRFPRLWPILMIIIITIFIYMERNTIPEIKFIFVAKGINKEIPFRHRK